MQTIISNIRNISNWAATTNPPYARPHKSSTTMSSKNSTTKIWIYSHSPSTHGHNLDQCYSLFSQHCDARNRKTGTLTVPMQHSCTNGLQHHPAPLESSPMLTFNGLTQNPSHAERSLATLTQPQPPAYTQSNLWDLASPKPLAHFNAQQPVSTFSIPVHTIFHLYTFLTLENTYDICR